MGKKAVQPVPRLTNFYAWLKTQGKNQAERGRTIGVSTRCIEYWESGKRWPTVSMLWRCPDGLRALADDLEKSNEHR